MTDSQNPGFPDEADLVRFIAREAQLIDDAQYEDWLTLFAPDALYWVPLQPTQTEPDASTSLACEDNLLLRIRVDRLQHPNAHSQHPASRCVHILQPSQLIDAEQANNRYTLRTPFIYAEQRGQQHFQLTGVATHQLVLIDSQIRIAQKRVDLLGADQPLPMIQLFP